MQIEIDRNSGFCFGVQRAIELAEDALSKGEKVFCVGEIVHNAEEVKRLERKGLKIIDVSQLSEISDSGVLVRAHGEPPSTFETIHKNNNRLFEGTCPIVKQIQRTIKKVWEESKTVNGQIVIFGKVAHAEVIGINGQINNEGIVISGIDELNKIDFSRPVSLFAQTTMDGSAYQHLADEIQHRMKETSGSEEIVFRKFKTICGHVSGRGEKLKIFASNHDIIIFVSGLNSSNGKVLYELCKGVNPNTYWVANEDGLKKEWFEGKVNVGICGATSTPQWLMENVAGAIKRLD